MAKDIAEAADPLAMAVRFTALHMFLPSSRTAYSVEILRVYMAAQYIAKIPPAPFSVNASSRTTLEPMAAQSRCGVLLVPSSTIANS